MRSYTMRRSNDSLTDRLIESGIAELQERLGVAENRPDDVDMIQDTFNKTKAGRILRVINRVLYLTEFLSWPLAFLLGSIGVHKLTEIPRSIRSLETGLGLAIGAAAIFVEGMIMAGVRDGIQWEIDQRLSAISYDSAYSDEGGPDSLIRS